MKNFLLSLAFGLSSFSVFAESYDLKTLDKLGTCTPGTIKEKNGQMALDNLKAFLWWNMKDQLNMFSDNFIAWHASLAGLIETNPAVDAVVPFKKGQFDKKSFVETMAFLAFANDLEHYKVVPTRVDCIGDNSVVLLTNFTGLQVRREPTNGCITHGVPFGSRTHLDVHLKSFEIATDGTQIEVAGTEAFNPETHAPRKRFITRIFSHLDDYVSANVRKELAAVVGNVNNPNPSNVKMEPEKCKTKSQILKEFQEQLEN